MPVTLLLSLNADGLRPMVKYRTHREVRLTFGEET